MAKNSVSEANKRYNQLNTEFTSSWEASLKDLRDYIEPTRGSFDEEDADRGEMIDHQKLLDGYPSIANEILASGLMSGMTSPVRPWFKLAIEDDLFNDQPYVRIWLDDTEKRIRTTINQSNLNQVLYGTYKELGAFGTACFLLLEDDEDIVRGYPLTAGEYRLIIDNKGRVAGMARSFWQTVEQMVDEYGEENCSAQVQSQYKSNNRNAYYKVKHLIEKNNFDIDGVPMNKEYRSLYWEAGNESEFLATRGFDRVVVLGPRWEVAVFSQPYGKGPGWKALGDIKQLEKTCDDKLKIQEKLHNPPVNVPDDVEGHIDLLPGGVTKNSLTVPDGGVKAAYTVPDALNSFIEMENHLKGNIDKFFFVNLFQMLMNMDSKNMTATEVAERQAEKIMMMGPVLHRLQEELLDPLIDMIFSVLYDNGMLLPPPDSLVGVPLRVKYISILAQAQEAVGVNQIKQVLVTAIEVASVRPDILDNYDFDVIAKELVEMEGAPAKMVKDEDVVEAERQQRNQMAQMAQMAQVGKDGASAVKDIASTQEVGK